MSTNTDIWQQIVTMLKQGISLIPVHDKGEKAKRPYAGWKEFQSRLPLEGELYESLERYNTTAVAMVCGAVSGNMEVIDVDVKNWAGINTLLGIELKALVPELVNKLRYHRTPSGGMHIIYRIDSHAPEGNLKLCYKDGETGAAIETRGEGGYVLMPPSLGYKAITNVDIQTITWDERCSLIAICRSLNQKISIQKPKPKKSEIDYYNENPFDHFAGSEQAANVLGWKKIKETNKYIYYTRPGKSSGVSASFDLERRYYYIFTSSTQYEPSKGYSPATILAMEQFGGDMRKCYAELVSRGFGKIKPDKERAAAERLARANKPPLPNFSDEAKALHTSTVEQLAKQYPFGTFWNYDDEGNPTISRENIQTVAAQLGFRLYSNELRQIQDQLLHRRTTREFIDTLKAYITEEDAGIYEPISNAFEAFMERHATYTIGRMPIIEPKQILRDTRTDAYKFYNNTVLHLTAEGLEMLDYTTIEGFVLAEKMLNRNFVNSDQQGRFTEFLNLAIGITPELIQTVGYLVHDYRDSSQGWIVVLTESCADAKDGGGAGKSAFCELLKPITGVLVKNAVQFTYDERSFGSWNGERIFVIADAPKDFRYDWLKESATGTLTVRKMHRDAVDVPTVDAPKFVVNTNHSFVATDGGMDRRVIPIEFTNFFNRSRSIDQYFNAYFPNDFTHEDWVNYDNFMALCLVEFLKVGKLSQTILSSGGREKQLKQKHGEVAYDFVLENLESWRQRGLVAMNEVRERLVEFCNETSISLHFRPTMKRICACIRDFDNDVEVNVNVKINSIQSKYLRWKNQTTEDLPY